MRSDKREHNEEVTERLELSEAIPLGLLSCSLVSECRLQFIVCWLLPICSFWCCCWHRRTQKPSYRSAPDSPAVLFRGSFALLFFRFSVTLSCFVFLSNDYCVHAFVQCVFGSVYHCQKMIQSQGLKPYFPLDYIGFSGKWRNIMVSLHFLKLANITILFLSKTQVNSPVCACQC